MSDDLDHDEFSHLPTAGSEEEIRRAKAELWRKIAEQHREPSQELAEGPEEMGLDSEPDPEPEFQSPEARGERLPSDHIAPSMPGQDGKAMWEEFLRESAPEPGRSPQTNTPEAPVNASPEPIHEATPPVRLSDGGKDPVGGKEDHKVLSDEGRQSSEEKEGPPDDDAPNPPELPKGSGELPEEPADNSELLANDRKRAWIAAGIFHGVILLVMAIVRVVPMEPKLAEIVAIPAVEEVEKPSWKKVTTAMPKSATLQPMVAPIMANATSNFAMPDVDMSPTASELNVGASFGSFGAGMSNGGFGNVSFMGNQAAGKNIVFVVDVSGSMSSLVTGGASISTTRFDLLKRELNKSLSQIPTGAKYQIVYFSDFAWPHNLIEPDAYGSEAHMKWDLEPDDDSAPRMSYVSANPSTLRQSREIVSASRPFQGTNWGSGLMMALRAGPTPDVVFFMTDGEDTNAQKWIDMATRQNGRSKRAIVHVTGMMIYPRTAEPLAELARRNGGKFTVVMANGAVIDGDDYFSGRR